MQLRTQVISSDERYEVGCRLQRPVDPLVKHGKESSVRRTGERLKEGCGDRDAAHG